MIAWRPILGSYVRTYQKRAIEANNGRPKIEIAISSNQSLFLDTRRDAAGLLLRQGNLPHFHVSRDVFTGCILLYRRCGAAVQVVNEPTTLPQLNLRKGSCILQIRRRKEQKRKLIASSWTKEQQMTKELDAGKLKKYRLWSPFNHYFFFLFLFSLISHRIIISFR